MNRERAKELLVVIQAYVDGKEIQGSNSDDDRWVIDKDPSFSIACDWRVRPLTSEGEALAQQREGLVNVDGVDIRR